jgi:hypothetical protein
MNKQQHTAEPWKVDTLGGTTVWASEKGGACIADCGTSDLNGHVGRRSVGEERANARRIVACVIACAGYTTEELEAQHPAPLVTKLLNQRDTAEQQRDKLLTASKVALDWIMTQNAVPAAMRDRLYEAITEAELTK